MNLILGSGAVPRTSNTFRSTLSFGEECPTFAKTTRHSMQMSTRDQYI